MIASALASAVAPSVSMVSSAARLGVHSFDVARLAYAQRRVDEDLDESIRADHVAHAVARGAIRTDRGAHGGAAMAHDFGGDESDAQDVRVAILFGEAETFGQMRAHHVAVEKRHLPAALEQAGDEDLRRGRFSGPAQSREPDAESLAMPRRMALRQDLGHFAAREPLRQRPAGAEVVLTNFCAERERVSRG